MDSPDGLASGFPGRSRRKGTSIGDVAEAVGGDHRDRRFWWIGKAEDEVPSPSSVMRSRRCAVASGSSTDKVKSTGPSTGTGSTGAMTVNAGGLVSTRKLRSRLTCVRSPPESTSTRSRYSPSERLETVKDAVPSSLTSTGIEVPSMKATIASKFWSEVTATTSGRSAAP